nr:hypothetical protein B0A51_10020 [Rachicladosporium sp. CCFEE 5018]
MDPNGVERQDAVEATAQEAQDLQVSYRRNGKLFSCEPCRKGKLRCDHVTPTCGRCIKRNKPGLCVYHPAPLTKTRTSPPPGATRGPASPASSGSYRFSPYPAPPATAPLDRRRNGLMSPPEIAQGAEYSGYRLNGTTTGQSSLVQSPVLPMQQPALDGHQRSASSVLSATPESAMSFRDNKTGFLGPTAYSAVYTENPGSLSILEPEEAEDVSNLPPISPEKIQMGADVLALLQDMPRYQRFVQRWFDSCDGIVVMQPVFRVWIDEMWREFGSLLSEGRPDQLYALSELIWRNTRRPMKTHGQMTAHEWAKAASGRGLRWEVVGILLSLIGLVAVNLSNWDTIFDDIREAIVDRATFAERMRKASDQCLCYCYECETLNDLYICFMYEDLVLLECLKGDAHYSSWQRTGELCDAVVAMGLHQGNQTDGDTPFFLAQLRKKIFISVYARDKVVASFLGRPPRLSYRYCKMDMPLDLNDEQLFETGAELEATLKTIDADGWNTCGNLNRNTWIRVWFLECRLREEILELALGPQQEDFELRSNGIRRAQERLHASFPGFMKISPEEVLNVSEGTMGMEAHSGRREKAMRQLNALFLVCIHAGIMHTDFLLLRALVSRMKTDTKQLIPISRRLLKLILLAQAKRDFFRDFQGDLVYLLTTHGLPSAGVLAVELLKQEQSRQYAQDILPRSEIIQDISVFISALAAVGPGEGNYGICNQGRRALKRVLDMVLSPPAPIPAAQQQAADGAKGFDEMSFFMPTGNDADFLQWLDTVEFDAVLNNGAMPAVGGADLV